MRELPRHGRAGSQLPGAPSPSLRALRREFVLDTEGVAEISDDLVNVQHVAVSEGDILGLRGGYIESVFARELNQSVVAAETGLPVTGLESRRTRATLYHASPSAEYAIDPRTKAKLGYDFGHRQQVGATTSETQEATGVLEHAWTGIDTIAVAYAFRRFAFDEAAPANPSATPSPGEPRSEPKTKETSHSVTVGWSRQLSRLTRVALAGGPRFSDGSVGPEASASISRTLEGGVADFTYARTQATAVGISGALDIESFAATIRYELLEALTTSIGGGLYRNSRPDQSSDVYTANLEVRYRLREWLSLVGSYQFSYQTGNIDSSPGAANRKIYHSIAAFGVEAVEPFRVY